MSTHIDIVFDKLPGHENPGFIEVENAFGQSIKFGEWVEREDGYAVLRIPNPDLLLMSLGSIIAHLLEFVDTGSEFDLGAALSGLHTSGLIEWAEKNPAMLPVRRDQKPQAARFRGEG